MGLANEIAKSALAGDTMTYVLLIILIALLVGVINKLSVVNMQLVDIRINVGILQRRGLTVETTLEEMGNAKLGVGLDRRFNDRRPDGGV